MTDVAQKSQQHAIIGIVVSDSMTNTVVVEVEHKIKHPEYHKFVTRKKRFVANVADVTCKVGDKVSLKQIRPISKTKKWQVSAIVH